MIKQIIIANEATYPAVPVEVAGLKKINFFFGGNGTGKSTLARVLRDPASARHCKVEWTNDQSLEVLVYNRGFVEREFDESAELRGIFTLGRGNIEAVEKIRGLRTEIDDLREKQNTLLRTLRGEDGQGGKKKKLQELESELEETCWLQKTKHEEYFREAFRRHRVLGSKASFKNHVLEELQSNSSALRPLIDLQEDAEAVFVDAPSAETPVPTMPTLSSSAVESSPLLQKAIIGSADVGIAPMIERLRNSDWVRAGLPYLNINDDHCPFCQQPAPEDLAHELARYFDEGFEKDINSLEQLEQDYLKIYEAVKRSVSKVSESQNRFFDHDEFEVEAGALRSVFELNTERLRTKLDEPSRKIELASTGSVTSSV